MTVGLVSGITLGLLMIVLSFIGVDADHPTTDIIGVITLGAESLLSASLVAASVVTSLLRMQAQKSSTLA